MSQLMSNNITKTCSRYNIALLAVLINRRHEFVSRRFKSSYSEIGLVRKDFSLLPRHQTQMNWPPRLVVKNLQLYYEFERYHHFDQNEFQAGADQAIRFVSKNIADCKFDKLEGLVENQVIQLLKERHRTLSAIERGFIDVTGQICRWPSQMIVLKKKKKSDVIHAEIDFIANYKIDWLRGELPAEYDNITGRERARHALHNKNSIVHYRFQRDFSEDERTEWIIKDLNHYSFYVAGREIYRLPILYVLHRFF